MLQAGSRSTGDTGYTDVGTFNWIEADCREPAVACHDNDPFTKAGIYERSFIQRFQ